MRRVALITVLSLAAAFGLMQLVPYRVSNPSARQEPQWDSPRTRELAARGCYDCHSNEVHTPWYGKIAPMSWMVTKHVRDGRAALNFSEWTGPGGERGSEAAETVRDGSMPPSYYTWFGLHGGARLTPSEREQLANGLVASLNR